MGLIEFNGARRIPFIGREDLLAEAERRIGRGGVHLLYFQGEGGMGKTALLDAILEQSRRGRKGEVLPGCCVASELIDLDAIEVYTVEGLIQKIVHVLGTWSFPETEKALTALEQARLAGNAETAAAQTRALENAFREELLALTDDGLVLAFDNLEVLEYERDPFQEELGREAPVLSGGEWLLRSFLPSLRGNVLVLLAGRPSGLVDRFEALQERNPHLILRLFAVPAFTVEETTEYLKAVAQAEARRGDTDAATRLWTFATGRSEAIHLLTGGRPILLALLAEAIGRGWSLPSLLDSTLEELRLRDIEDRQEEMERALIALVQQCPAPIGNTLRALAWLPKGATPELLARVMDLRTARGEWDVYTATGYLDQAAQLALVRVRPGDRRVFLHDELYALLEKHTLEKCSEEERDGIYDAIQKYYRELTRELEQRVDQFPAVTLSIRARRRQALVEEMHYRLRHSPPLGFALYFWLAEEALDGRDLQMDMLLRTELQRTLGLLQAGEQFMGFVPREAEVDGAVRWGIRVLLLQGDPEGALHIFDQVRKRWGKQAGKLGLAWAHLQLYRAVAKIHRAEGNDWQEARELLAAVMEKTEEVLRSPPDTPVVKGRRWQAKVLQSLALNYHGYLDRQQGRYEEAVAHYHQSALLQRRLEMAALVPTLIHLSGVMALTGQVGHAHLLVEEAERHARRAGNIPILAQALNARAVVELVDGHHRAAIRTTDRALEMVAEVPSFRVRGLIHLTRARAHRYLWDSLAPDEKQREAGLLDEMIKEANQAVNLLRNSPADRLDALIERGCVCRQVAREYQRQGRKTEAEDLTEISRKDFERAAALAGALNLPGQQALAWTNLGWLCYYRGELEGIEEALYSAYTALPKDYLFPAQGPLPPVAQNGNRNEAALPYWNTLGKAEMLKACLALDQAPAAADDRDRVACIREAVKHLTLSLAYDELVADDYWGLRRAEENLHRRILEDGLNIRMLHQYAQRVAQEQGLTQPTRFQQFLNRIFGPPELWM